MHNVNTVVVDKDLLSLFEIGKLSSKANITCPGVGPSAPGTSRTLGSGTALVASSLTYHKITEGVDLDVSAGTANVPIVAVLSALNSTPGNPLDCLCLRPGCCILRTAPGVASGGAISPSIGIMYNVASSITPHRVRTPGSNRTTVLSAVASLDCALLGTCGITLVPHGVGLMTGVLTGITTGVPPTENSIAGPVAVGASTPSGGTAVATTSFKECLVDPSLKEEGLPKDTSALPCLLKPVGVYDPHKVPVGCPRTSTSH